MLIVLALLAATADPVLSLPGQPGPLAFSPDGTRLVTSSTDTPAGHGSQVRVWDAATGQPVGPAVDGGGAGVSLAFRPDGKQFATGGSDGTARLWSLPDGKPVARLKCEGRVEAVVYSPDGKRLATQSVSHTDEVRARVWDTTTGAAVPLTQARRAGPGRLAPPAFAADGTLAPPPAADPDDWQQKLPNRDLLILSAASADGRRRLFGWADGTVRVYDGTPGTPVGDPIRLGRDGAPGLIGLALTADGKTAFAATGALFGMPVAPRLFRWTVGERTGEPFRTLEAGADTGGLAAAPDGRTLAVVRVERLPAQRRRADVLLIPAR